MTTKRTGEPWTTPAERGLGAEIRLMGLDPDDTERRARAAGHTVVLGAKDWPHGWRDRVREDPDGYTFAVGVPLT